MTSNSRPKGRPSARSVAAARKKAAASTESPGLSPPNFGFPDSILLVPAKTPSRRLLVVFSAANAVNFTFFKNTESLDCDRLFIRDPFLNAWYQKGFLGQTGLDHSLSVLREIAHGYDHVTMVGSSMGAYAAIVFGIMLDVDEVLAIGPQTLLNAAYSRSPPKAVKLLHPAIDPFLTQDRKTRVNMLVGLLDGVDFFNISRLPQEASFDIYSFPEEDHFLPKRLAENGVLTEAIRLTQEGQPLTFEGMNVTRDYAFDDARANTIRIVVPLIFEEKAYGRARTILNGALAEDPDWALGNYLWAAAAFKDGHHGSAFKRVRLIANQHPAVLDFNSLAAEAALASDKPDQAKQFARNMLMVRSGLKRAREIFEGRALTITSDAIALDQAPPEVAEASVK